MSRLGCWGLIVVTGLISDGACRGQDLNLNPQLEKGVIEDPYRDRRAIKELELLVDPASPAERPEIREHLRHLPQERSNQNREVRQPFQFRNGNSRVRVVHGIVEYPAGQPRSMPASPLQTANVQRQQLIESLQALQDAYCRNAQLDEALAVRNMIRQLKTQADLASQLPDPAVALTPSKTTDQIASSEPADIVKLRGQNEVAFYRRITGTTGESVWGGASNLYTDDSSLSSAAVHAGLLKAGETAVVRFSIQPGRENYPGTTRNGVTTRPWKSWEGSYRIEGVARELTSLADLRGQDLPPFAVYVVGSRSGRVWGNGSYTDDSDLGTAAVHAGLLKPGEAGFVMVKLEAGKTSYECSTQNGVTTRPFNSSEGGFRLSKYHVNYVYVEAYRRSGIMIDVF